jgi:hypothetical protein
MGGKVGVLRTRTGDLKIVDGKRFIFTKDGIYFTLDEEQMQQLGELMSGDLDGTLRHIDPASDEMVLAD